MNVQISEQTLADARVIAKDVHSMLVVSYKFDGTTCKPLPAITLRDTIAAKLVEPGELLRVQLVYPENGPDDRWYAACEALLGGGVEHKGQRYKVLGGSSSLKNGNVWCATEEVTKRLHSYFSTSQEALSYLGVFFSGCHHGIHRLDDVQGIVVEDCERDTADGMGFIARELMQELDLPERQIQVRFVSDVEGREWIAKGTLLPTDLPDGLQFILPTSMIKGKGTPPADLSWSCWFGIRDIAKTRPYSSSFSVAQWFDDATLDAVWPSAERQLSVIKRAVSDRNSALRFLGLLNGDEDLDPARSKAEAFLEAGIGPDHPWLRRQLIQMMRRAFIRLALGGGIELEGRMGAWADLPDGVICAVDLPAGPVMLSRYPVRDPHSLQAVWNERDAIEGALPGTIYLNNEDALQLDGDYDGDYYVTCSQEPVVDAVSSPNWYPDYRRVDTPPKHRCSDPLNALPFVAVSSIGNRIGTISYAISGALHAGQQDKIAKLSASLQAEVQSLKWDTKADRALFDSPDLSIPDYIASAKTDRDLFVHHAEEIEGSFPLIRNYNRVVRAWQRDLPATRSLVEFKHHLPIWLEPAALDQVEECKAVTMTYNRWVASILEKVKQPSMDDLAGPLAFLQAWDQSKLGERHAWAVALWHVTHGSRADSTASPSFHCFIDEATALIADTAGFEAPIRQVRTSSELSTDHSQAKDDSQPGNSDTTSGQHPLAVIPLVGAWQRQKEIDGAGFGALRRLSKEGQVKIHIRTGNGHGAEFYTRDQYLGTIPRDHLLFGSVQPGAGFSARVQLRGRTVYLMPLTTDWFATAPANN